MTVLRSARAATGVAAEVFAQLQALHPQEENRDLFEDQTLGDNSQQRPLITSQETGWPDKSKWSAAETAVDPWFGYCQEM
jgi:hypothetical protein